MKVINELNLTSNAVKVLERRYLKKDEEGKVIESPEELFKRVAKTVAQADLNYGKSQAEVEYIEKEFYKLLTSLRFLPNSPTLMNAGRRLGQLSACFVLPVEDSMESIFEAVKNAALIHKSGGGTGFSFSNLRPKGDIVGSTKGISSGPVSFMTVFDSATEAIKQGGTRRGANMGILRVDHPDILEFITSKDDNGKLNNFNISVALTDSFMKALEKDEEYELINPHTGMPTKRLKARDVFNLIVNHAWGNGEPGIIFIDRINKANPTPLLGKIESTNPCGEQPLLPYESCNLGSINLARFVKTNGSAIFSGEKKENISDLVDWDSLRRTVHLSVHFLDNVIDVNKYPLKKIEEMTKCNRKIGLGVMGWADMLIQLGIPYNSENASRLATEVMRFIRDEGRKESMVLAEERGVFPNHEYSIYKDMNMRLRNASITTIAPTGTLSIIAGCSSGIEPIFAVAYIRNVMEGTKLYEVNPYFEKIANEMGFWSRELVEKIGETGSLQELDVVPREIKKMFTTAHDISPLDHIRMQAAFQKYVDNAVSKTINFPHNAAPKDVEDAYMLAYGLGCKGVTVYRDGSRDEQVLEKGQRGKGAEGQGKDTVESLNPRTIEPSLKIVPRKRPEVIEGTTRLMKTGCGHLYVTINEDKDGNLFELFTHMGKAGGCAASQAEAIGRLVSLALRSNIEPVEIVKQLRGISCHSPAWTNGGKILSCSDAIAKSLEKYSQLGDKGNGSDPQTGKKLIFGACPECGGAVEHEGGCAVCRDCGFTRCS